VKGSDDGCEGEKWSAEGQRGGARAAQRRCAACGASAGQKRGTRSTGRGSAEGDAGRGVQDSARGCGGERRGAGAQGRRGERGVRGAEGAGRWVQSGAWAQEGGGSMGRQSAHSATEAEDSGRSDQMVCCFVSNGCPVPALGTIRRRLLGIVTLNRGKTVRKGGIGMAPMGHAEESCPDITWRAHRKIPGQRR
jgi:hypothetical protein